MSWGNLQSPALWQDTTDFERPPSLVPWFSRFSACTHNQDSEFKGLGWGYGIYVTELPGIPAQAVHRPHSAGH